MLRGDKRGAGWRIVVIFGEKEKIVVSPRFILKVTLIPSCNTHSESNAFSKISAYKCLSLKEVPLI